MSDLVTLALRARIDHRLELEGVTPDRLSEMSEREIAALPVWSGRRPAQLGDFFSVRGERSSRVRVEGDLSNASGLATGMSGGDVVVDGHAGDRLAAAMTGGSVAVRGDAGDEAGVAMRGGTLRVSGNAGDRLGAAEAGAAIGMIGGEIVVERSAGSDAAARCRRGLVVVGADVGDRAARAMIAGTLVVLGRVGAAPGQGSKRGSIVARELTDLPVTYRYACTYEPPFVRLLVHYLNRRYDLRIDSRVRDGRFHRYCGDGRSPGKGEILAWASGDS